MKRYAPYALAILFLALIVELVVVSPTDLKDDYKTKSETVDETAPEENIEQKLDTIHVIETRDESKEWELWADKAISLRDSEEMIINEVKAQFYSPNGVQFNVTGNEGSVYPQSKNMQIDGDVITKSSNGYTFRTSTVKYDSAKSYLLSPNPVEVVGPKDNGKPLYLKGQTMEADLDKGIMLVHRDVRAEKVVNENRLLTVNADTAQLSGQDKKVRFLGNVVIDIDGVKITGPDALFHYEEGENILKTVELDGGVKVSDLNKKATSQKLKINLADNKYIFDGNPKVIQDDDEVSGDRIIFLDGGKKVKVENAKIKMSKESVEKLGEKEKARK